MNQRTLPNAALQRARFFCDPLQEHGYAFLSRISASAI